MATVVSKRYDAAAAKVDPAKPYSVEEAIGTLKGMPAAKFDESVDLSFRLGVDPKHADQMVRGAVVLPHGIGKTVRVAVFAKGEKEPAAAKGTYLRTLSVSSTMSPAVRIDAQAVANLFKKATG